MSRNFCWVSDIAELARNASNVVPVHHRTGIGKPCWVMIFLFSLSNQPRRSCPLKLFCLRFIGSGSWCHCLSLSLFCIACSFMLLSPPPAHQEASGNQGSIFASSRGCSLLLMDFAGDPQASSARGLRPLRARFECASRALPARNPHVLSSRARAPRANFPVQIK